MKVERRVIIGKAGGNASKNAKNYKISIPADMIKELGISEENRNVIMELKDKKIIITKVD